MKPMFQHSLARLRARSNAASTSSPIDPKAVIERALRDAGLMPAASATPPAGIDRSVVDGEFRVVKARILDVHLFDAHGETASPVADTTASVTDKGSFSSGRFALGGDSRGYKLFVPADFAGERLPLIVMLHGCTQDPDDFARGTRMNALAQEIGALVLYPTQAQRSNSARCWNWFQPGDQQRDAGEPALLAAMTRHVMATHQVDPHRVHVAGLSAGGAMAAILGREYPEIYASIGVHSGLPPGAAHDVQSAFATMKKASHGNPQTPKTPVIVFHGDRDRTVDPRNGANVLGASGTRTQASGESGRRYTRTVVKDVDDKVRAEHWLVHGAGHAWSGGSSTGSYADALGPDASREMLRFFHEHPLAQEG